MCAAVGLILKNLLMKRIEGVVCSVVQLPAWGEHDRKEKWRKEEGGGRGGGERERGMFDIQR